MNYVGANSRGGYKRRKPAKKGIFNSFFWIFSQSRNFSTIGHHWVINEIMGCKEICWQFCRFNPPPTPSNFKFWGVRGRIGGVSLNDYSVMLVVTNGYNVPWFWRGGECWINIVMLHRSLGSIRALAKSRLSKSWTFMFLVRYFHFPLRMSRANRSDEIFHFPIFYIV